MATVLVGPDVDLLAWYDALPEDPPGHRLEVLEGVLLVSPSPGGTHQDRARGLADLIDVLLEGTGLRAREDFDWPLTHPVKGLGSRLRPDVSVLDPDDPAGPRMITVEVLSASDAERVVPGQPGTRIEGKRRAYAYGGTRVHLEVEQVGDTVEVRWYRLTDGRLELAGTAAGSETLEVGGPYPFSLVPDELGDWTRRRMAELRERADAERERADAERERADALRARAEHAEAALRERGDDAGRPT